MIKPHPKKPALSTLNNPNLSIKVNSLPREVIKWIQSLDLTYSVKNVKKDLNNGFLVSQILSRYYPITNNKIDNLRAIHVNQIDNGHSTACKKDNWEQIKKFLKKIPEITVKIGDVDTFIKNENGEILLFVIALYQDLTQRKIPIMEGKTINTDVDNINKSFLLKENGQIQKLKKEELDNMLNANISNVIAGLQGSEPTGKGAQDNTQDRKDDMLKTSKTQNSFLSKGTNVVMKGEVRQIGDHLDQIEKGFKIEIEPPEEVERDIKVVKAIKNQDILFNENVGVPKYEQQEKLNFKPLKNDEKEFDAKANAQGNPFQIMAQQVSEKIKESFPEDHKLIIQSERSFLYDLFKAAKDLSDGVIQVVMDGIVELIEQFYNIISNKQVNDYIDLFLIIFNCYLDLEPTEDQNKFTYLHKGLIRVFKKSLKNKNDEMIYIFNNIIIERIFDAINEKLYSDKIDFLCDLLFSLLSPTDEQQVQLFKMFRDKVHNEEILYHCFAILNDRLNELTNSLIDGCLFYILNGISHENPNIRFYSMQILKKYGMANVNFIYNFQKVLTKLAKKEKDKENCLLIIEILCQLLKHNLEKKTPPPQPNDKKTITVDKKENNSPDNLVDKQLIQNDINYVNSLIKIIISKFRGDDVFLLLCLRSIFYYLYDNYELYKIILEAVYNCNESIFSFIFYDDDLKDDIVKEKYYHTIFRGNFSIEKLTNWNKVMLFKAFSMLIEENKIEELSMRDYTFLRYLTSSEIEHDDSEIWKNSFNFSNLIIQDMKNDEKAPFTFGILESFILAKDIQKQMFDDWYENLNKVINEIMAEGNTKCKDLFVQNLEQWGKNEKIRQIVRDDIKKLMECIPKNTAYNTSKHLTDMNVVSNSIKTSNDKPMEDNENDINDSNQQVEEQKE